MRNIAFILLLSISLQLNSNPIVFSKKKGEIATGAVTGSYSEGTFSFTNTIESQTYSAKYCVDNGMIKNVTLLMVFPGWGNDNSVFDQTCMRRFASYGFFVVALSSKNGLGYANQKNLYATYDCVSYVHTNFSNVSKTRTVACGYSAGGAYVLGLISCFPDLFTCSVDNFGISDFGYDGSNSWYFSNTSYQSSLNSIINRSTQLSTYQSIRDRESCNNYRGYLYIFHDTADANVSIISSRQLINGLNIRYEFHKSLTTDATRWLHAYPTGSNPIIQAENYWKSKAFKEQEKQVQLLGTFTISSSFLVTKKFKVVLNNYACDAKATVTYNLVGNSFTVNPTSGSQTVAITYNGSTQTQTISSITNFNF